MKPALALCAAALSIASVSALAASPAAAQPEGLHDLINTFTEDMQYYPRNGWGIFGQARGDQSFAVPFTPDRDYDLKDITVGAEHNWSDTTNTVTVTLNEDAGGVPGDEIKKHRFTDLPEFHECCEVATFKAKGIAVTGGTKYWVVLKAGKAMDADMVWNFNADSTMGSMVFRKAGGPWTPWTDILPALRVRGK